MTAKKLHFNTARAKKLGYQITSARKDHSIQDVALVTDVDKNTLLSYELGRSLPGISFLAKFSRRYDAPFFSLLALRLQAETDSDVCMVGDALSGHFSVMAAEPSLPGDVDQLRTAIFAFEKYQRKRKKKMRPEDKAQAIAAVYSMKLLHKPLTAKLIDEALRDTFEMRLVREIKSAQSRARRHQKI